MINRRKNIIGKAISERAGLSTAILDRRREIQEERLYNTQRHKDLYRLFHATLTPQPLSDNESEQF